mgnify:FL=1
MYILFSSLSLYSQSVEILTDSVYIDGEYYELQEVDYSNGAKYWDGVEQSHLPPENPDATNKDGTQYHINVIGWTISDEHYNSWKNAITQKKGSGYFNVPQKKYAVANHGGMKNKDKIRLSSVAQYGLTIFWKEVNIQKT